MEISALYVLLALIIFILTIWLTYKLASLKADLKWQKNLVSLRRDIANQQRAGIKGKVSETFAPFLEGFPFKPSECKFLGDPIDYVVFEGLDNRNITGIHLVEVKEGTSQLSKHQKQIKDLIDNLGSDDITFKEFRFRSE
jgi:predicted Holliday junction resolvase-like endonuclease